MNIIASIFGKKPPTASDIAREIERASAELAKAKARAASTREALTGIAIMDDASHQAAETFHAAAHREVARLQSRIGALHEGHAIAQEKEAAAALEARKMAARRLLEVEAPKLLDEHDVLGEKMARNADRLQSIREEVEGVNRELPAGERLPSIDALYRTEPDEITPPQTEQQTVWVKHDRYGAIEVASIFVRNERGELVPRDAGYQPEVREVLIAPEHVRRGLWLDSLESMIIPAGKIGNGRTHHWPRGEN
jgi:hypothetical protein